MCVEGSLLTAFNNLRSSYNGPGKRDLSPDESWLRWQQQILVRKQDLGRRSWPMPNRWVSVVSPVLLRWREESLQWAGSRSWPIGPRRDTKAHLVQLLHFIDGDTETTQGEGLTQSHVSVSESGLLAQKSVQSAPSPDSGRSFWQPQGTTRPGEDDMRTQKAKIGKLFLRSKEEGILQVPKLDGLPHPDRMGLWWEAVLPHWHPQLPPGLVLLQGGPQGCSPTPEPTRSHVYNFPPAEGWQLLSSSP